MIRRWMIGPHGGIGNYMPNIGDHWRELNRQGIPAVYKGVDDYGSCLELLQIGDEEGVENLTVFRMANLHGINWDVPNWHAGSPQLAAIEHVDKTLAHLPSEFDKRTWLEIINEPDKDEDTNFPDWGTYEFTEWLAEFMITACEMLLGKGYKVAGFGFSSGEPEIVDWYVPRMQDFLGLAAHNPNVALALHEYSFLGDELISTAPWLIGRFEKLFEVCDELNIKRPKILITEFGWALWELPVPEVAISQLIEVADQLYGPHPEIMGAFVWFYGIGWQQIQFKAARLLEPMFSTAMTWEMEIDDEENDMSFEEELWERSIEEQIMRFNPEAAFQRKIFNDGFVPVSNEYRQEIEGQLYAAQVGEQLSSGERRVYFTEDGNWGNIRWINSPEEETTGPPIDPPPPEPPPPQSGDFDLLQYMVPGPGNGPIFEIKRADGSQERVQIQVSQTSKEFYVTKGTGGKNGKSEFEVLSWDNKFIHRGLDTSPGGDRFYHQYEEGKYFAKWCPRFMSVGQQWVGGGHKVQFFNKGDCSLSSPNSGPAVNVTKFFEHYDTVYFNGLAIDDVVKIGREDGEKFWFAKGMGMIGWESAWNSGFVSEIHQSGQRPDNEMETICRYVLP